MWNFLRGMLFAHAVRGSRFVRTALLLLLIGGIIAGAIYAVIVFNAVSERTSGHYVDHHSSH